MYKGRNVSDQCPEKVRKKYHFFEKLFFSVTVLIQTENGALTTPMKIFDKRLELFCSKYRNDGKTEFFYVDLSRNSSYGVVKCSFDTPAETSAPEN